MISISAEDLSLSFGTVSVLDGISFSANEGDKIGVIGVNGAGKTSLFRLLTGAYSPDRGNVYLQKGFRVGMLEQNPDLSALPKNLSMLEYTYTAFQNLLAAEARIADLENRLAALPTDRQEAIASLSAALDEENQRYRDGGGLEFRARCRSTLLRLGFSEALIGQKIGTLSGGEYTRLSLARLLLTEPDVLMLDEPTNHLDLDALCWLENYLVGYKKTVLVISHDRFFLDRVTNKTLMIESRRARLYPGNYSQSKEQRENERASQEKRYREQQKEIAKIRANIEFQRRCNQEHNYVTIRAKEKQLARMDLVEKVKKEPKDIRLSFSSLGESAGEVAVAKNLGFSYGGKSLIEGMTFTVKKGERVLFLGPNGSGKSTLMKLINGILTPTAGKLTMGYNIEIGYYDQENRGLSEKETVFGEMRTAYPGKTDLELRSTLALFLFGAEDMDKPVSTLSGGERARLTLAKLILKKVNLLVMDEPTNHLDIGSREALETALCAFDGTVIAVSHDRYFINRLATRIIELAPGQPYGCYDYPIENGEEAFSAYLSLREKQKETEKKPAVVTESAAKIDYEQQKRENAERKSRERKIEKARLRIPEIEKAIEDLDRELFGDAASDYKRAAEIEEEKAALEEELLSLYDLVM